ncbi:CobN/magnesium chelatase family protein [Porphyromonas crevioricanis JCM 15906]|uniref:CobN/magnesium chelatase family protein n=1 Tax=Porphyromonas crevioricanis JCM 15906 TaxID=1305617 RepID=T1DTJ9_9PORP|nr:cobaltochelatase subunit CobN [Porphyromonas crevioricanis]GAD06230.1 CobN/magnesium chelatase family protein [Porphyromonas crevioricanis JCM 15906]SJZ53499.1 cobaltochelatase CobN [Porphyromonas crevioricanis]
MKRLSSKAYVFILLATIVVVGLVVWLYPRKTTVALVNFPTYQVSAMAKSVADDPIRIVEVGTDELDKLQNCDAALIFAMGIRLTDEQREQILKLKEKNILFASLMPIDPSNDLSNIEESKLEILKKYLLKGGRSNYRSGLNFIRHELLGKSITRDAIVAAVDIPDNVFFNEFDERIDTTLTDYTNFLKNKELYQEGGKRIALFTGNFGPFNSNKDQLDELIKALREAHFNVYPLSSFSRRIELLEEIKPDAVVYLPHGRFSMMQSDAAVDYFRRNNIPVFAPLAVTGTHEDWLADSRGMSGGMLSQSIVMPEIDGALMSRALIAQYEGKEGFHEFHCIPDRLSVFVSSIKRYLSLRDKPNAEKHLAIYYYKGAGKAALSAAGMEATTSLYNLLLRLQSEGYNVAGLPASAKALEELIQQRGSFPAGFARTEVEKYLASNVPFWYTASEFSKDLKNDFPEDLVDSLARIYGEVPGGYMVRNGKGEGSIAVSRIELGNIALLPQPGMGGGGEDDFRLTHGSNPLPPYHYLASYLWTRHKFQADAIIHFGTHGSLEFIPGKQVGLSERDWTDAIVADIPHFYLYSIGNVGEGVIAKRRSYAQLISHLTPGFIHTGLDAQATPITELTSHYLSHDHDESSLNARIKAQAAKNGILRELRIDTTLSKPLSRDEIELIDNFAAELADAKISGGMYTLGEAFDAGKIRSSVVLMAVDPIAYSAAEVAKLKGRITDKQLKGSFFSTHFHRPAMKLVSSILASGHIDLSSAFRQMGITAADLTLSEAVESQQKNAKMAMMGSMMSVMGGSKGKAPAGMGSIGGKSGQMPHMQGKPQGMAGHPNMAKGKVMGKDSKSQKPSSTPEKTQAGAKPTASTAGKTMGQMPPVSLPSSRHPQQGMSMQQQLQGKDVEYSKQDVQLANAIAKLKETIQNVLLYRSYLQESPSKELDAMVNALAGGYTSPSPGGDFIANPNALPTGRNLYAINAEATPSAAAIEKGKQMAEEMLADYVRRHPGKYPEKVSFTLWSGSFVESEGATIAEIFYLLGVRPIADRFGRILDLELIPASELQRPRIDVVVQTSGQLRDLAASRLELIQKAVEMAAEAGDKDGDNFVAKGRQAAERILLDKGFAPQEARDLSTQRVFGALNGGYGTNIQGMVEAGDKWEDESQIAQVYLNNMGAVYGSGKDWGAFRAGVFEAALQNTDVVIQPRQSNTWGALSLDHVYEFMGGLTLTVRQVTGKDPEGYLNDLRNRHRARSQEIKTAIGIEARTTILNPTYIKQMIAEGAGSADAISETVRNTYGWNVMKPNAIDHELWQDIYDVYIEDKHNLGVANFFEDKNPTALQELTGTMLETIRKGYWPASEAQRKKLAEINAEMTSKYGADGAFTGQNHKLQSFIGEQLDASQRKAFEDKLAEQTGRSDREAVVLEKDKARQNLTNGADYTRYLVPIAAVLFVVVLIIIYVLRRKKKADE